MFEDVEFVYSQRKDVAFRQGRGIGFKEIIAVIEAQAWLDISFHPNQLKHPNQMIFLIELRGYVWVVPFDVDSNRIFLRTAYASRKATKYYGLKGH